MCSFLYVLFCDVLLVGSWFSFICHSMILHIFFLMITVTNQSHNSISRDLTDRPTDVTTKWCHTRSNWFRHKNSDTKSCRDHEYGSLFRCLSPPSTTPTPPTNGSSSVWQIPFSRAWFRPLPRKLLFRSKRLANATGDPRWLWGVPVCWVPRLRMLDGEFRMIG